MISIRQVCSFWPYQHPISILVRLACASASVILLTALQLETKASTLRQASFAPTRVRVAIFDEDDKVTESYVIIKNGSIKDLDGDYRIINIIPNKTGYKIYTVSKGHYKHTIVMIGRYKEKILKPYVPWPQYRFFGGQIGDLSLSRQGKASGRINNATSNFSSLSFPALVGDGTYTSAWGYKIPSKLIFNPNTIAVFLVPRPRWQSRYAREVTFKATGLEQTVQFVSSMPPGTVDFAIGNILVQNSPRKAYFFNSFVQNNEFTAFFIPGIPLPEGEGITFYARDTADAVNQIDLDGPPSRNLLMASANQLHSKPMISASLLSTLGSSRPIVQIRLGGIDRLATTFGSYDFKLTFDGGNSVSKTVPTGQYFNIPWPEDLPVKNSFIEVKGTTVGLFRRTEIKPTIYQVVSDDLAFSDGVGFYLRPIDESKSFSTASRVSHPGVMIRLPSTLFSKP